MLRGLREYAHVTYLTLDDWLSLLCTSMPIWSMVSPFCGIDRGVLLWGSICHRVKREASYFSAHLSS